jgi:hypothetical protein
VAAVAGQRAVRTSQRKVSAFVIEGRGVQAHDVGLAALVLGMAAGALADAGIGHAAVIALVTLQVGGDFLVAVDAQRALARTVGAIVAIAAGVFELGVRLGNLAGHEQALDRGAMSDRCGNERCCQHDSH